MSTPASGCLPYCSHGPSHRHPTKAPYPPLAEAAVYLVGGVPHDEMHGSYLDIRKEEHIVAATISLYAMSSIHRPNHLRFGPFLFQHCCNLLGLLQKIQRNMLSITWQSSLDSGRSARQTVDLGPSFGCLGQHFEHIVAGYAICASDYGCQALLVLWEDW
jgi:hypothetical protein